MSTIQQVFTLIIILSCLAVSCSQNGADDNTATSALKTADNTDGDTSKEQSTTSANDLVKITWSTLQNVTYEEKYYEEAGWMLFPTFGDSVKLLDGKEIFIEGYVIPVAPERYVLSANPFASCFFCGNAGPESVMELELTTYDEMYYTDEYKTFRGTFHLNDTNTEKLNYIISGAEPY